MTTLKKSATYETVKNVIKKSIWGNNMSFSNPFAHHKIEEKESKFVVMFNFGGLVVEYIEKFDTYHVFQLKNDVFGQNELIDDLSQRIQITLNEEYGIIAESTPEYEVRVNYGV